VRDKDGVQAAVMACEMAQYWKERGKTLFDVLQDIYSKYGFYKETLQSITLEGIAGQNKIEEAITYLRQTDVEKIGDANVLYKEDYFTKERIDMNDHAIETITLPKENVIKYLLVDDAWVCIRPSGTEPKVKLYFGVKGTSNSDAEARLKTLQEGFNKIIGDKLV